MPFLTGQSSATVPTGEDLELAAITLGTSAPHALTNNMRSYSSERWRVRGGIGCSGASRLAAVQPLPARLPAVFENFEGSQEWTTRSTARSSARR